MKFIWHKYAWKGFRSNENRKKIARHIADKKYLDEKAMEYLRLAVETSIVQKEGI